MGLLFVVLTLIFPTPPAHAAAAPDQALILLNQKDAAGVEAAIERLRALGIEAQHVLPGGAIIASVPTSAEAGANELPEVRAIIRVTVAIPASADPDTTTAIKIWNTLLQPETATDAPDGQPLVRDAFVPPEPDMSTSAVLAAAAPGTTQTSEFMIGKVAVGVIIPESNGSGENWSAARQDTVFSQIVTGLNWWVNKGGAAAHLTFYYDKKFSVPTQYEPITMQGYEDESTWVSDIFANMGYSSGTPFARARSYINNLRSTMATDWSFAIIVVDSLNDSDGMFTTGRFGYAWLGGPYVIMTYDNDGWGISRMNQVTSHETGHIFLADDEYCQQGYACCTSANAGYLNIPNTNCELDNPASVSCVMKSNDDYLCQYTWAQIGWRDSDSDGLPDTVDNTVGCTYSTITTPNDDSTPTIYGTATDIPCVAPLRSDVTINKITAVKWCIDGGVWSDAASADGAFDEDSESFTFTTQTLGAGLHTVQTQAFSSSGNASPVISSTLEVRLTTNVIYVNKANQNAVRDGSGWTTAYQTITQAISASTSGKEIWVASGDYAERITIKSGTAIYGGFAAREGVREERNARVNKTTLNGSSGGSTITVQSGATQTTVIDGFTVTGGLATNGGGFYIYTSSPTISGNIIIGNGATTTGGGIYCYGSNAVIVNNIISSNSASTGGGIRCSSGAPSIRNNTIVYNSTSTDGGAIYIMNSSPIIANNVVAYNSPGVFKISGSPTARSNCVGSNGAYDYSGLSSSGDVTSDPALAAADYQPMFTSPCVDTAAPADAPAKDIAGSIRPQDGDGDGTALPDIGAYERPLALSSAKRSLSDGTSVSVGDLVVTAAFPSMLYAEFADRSGGTRIDTSEAFALGQVINLSGAIKTDSTTGERYIEPTGQWPDLAAVAPVPAPLGMTNYALGGGPLGLQEGVWDAAESVDTVGVWRWNQSIGRNNLGLLVRVWGKITCIDPAGAYFYIDDGSGLYDGTSQRTPYPLGVRIAFDGRSYAIGNYVTVKGISSCIRSMGGPVVRVVKPCTSSDIRME